MPTPRTTFALSSKILTSTSQASMLNLRQLDICLLPQLCVTALSTICNRLSSLPY